MDIKTKYKVGDTLFTYDSLAGKLKMFKVSAVSTFNAVDYINISYYDEQHNPHEEGRCFTSREEFIENL